MAPNQTMAIKTDSNDVNNSNSPQVAVLLLNYNNYEDTSNCIDGLKEVDYSPVEIFVVDNGSTDCSQEQLQKEYNDLNFVFNEINHGFAGGVNRGIKTILSTEADYILLLNNDVEIVDSQFLRSMVDVGEKHPECGLISSKIVNGDQNKIIDCGREIKMLDLSFRNPYQGVQQSEMTGEVHVGGISGACMLIKREVVEDVGLLDEKNYFFGGEDVDYCIRVKDSGWSIIVQADHPIVHHVSSTAGQNSKFLTYHFTRNKIRRGITHFGTYGFIAIFIRFVLDFTIYNPVLNGDYESVVPQLLGYLDAFIGRSEDDRNYLNS